MDFVDLDKVLDDFESNEGTENSPHGAVMNNSGPQRVNEPVPSAKFELPASQIPLAYNQGFTELPPPSTVDYEPPDALDLSEADFGPSNDVGGGSGGNGGYFIPEGPKYGDTNGYFTHRQEQSVHPGLLRPEPGLNGSEYHRDSSINYAPVGLVNDLAMDSDCNDSDQEQNGKMSFFSSSPPGGGSIATPPVLPIDLTQGVSITTAGSPPVLPIDLTAGLSLTTSGSPAYQESDSGVSVSTGEQCDVILRESGRHSETSIVSSSSAHTAESSPALSGGSQGDISPEPEGEEASPEPQEDTSPEPSQAPETSNPQPDHTSPEPEAPQATEMDASQEPSDSITAVTDPSETICENDNSGPEAQINNFESALTEFKDPEPEPVAPRVSDNVVINESMTVDDVMNESERVAAEASISSDINVQSLQQELANIGVSGPASVVPGLEQLNSERAADNHSAAADSPVIGFGEDLQTAAYSDKDLESYLEQMHHDPSVEVDDALPDELQEALSSVTIATPQPEASLPSINTEEVAATVATPGELHLRPPSGGGDSRRGSGESVDKFLAAAPIIASPTITTPMEDTGFSKLPGFSPGLGSMAEAEEAGNTEDNSAPQNISGDAVVEDDTRVAEPAVPQPDPVLTEKPVAKRPTTIGGDAVMECVRPEAPRPPTSPGLGARPKESAITRKNRPNSLLGLSTPDLNAPSPIVVYPAQPSSDVTGQEGVSSAAPMSNSNDAINMQLAAQKIKSPLAKKQLNLEIQQQLIASEQSGEVAVPAPVVRPGGGVDAASGAPKPRPMSLGLPQLASQGLSPAPAEQQQPQPPAVVPHGTADIVFSIDEGQQGGLIPPAARPQRRPNSLNLSFNQEEAFPARQALQSPPSAADLSGGASPAEDLQPAVAEDSSGAQTPQSEEPGEDDMLPADGAAASSPMYSAPEPRVFSPPTSSNINLAITQLGKVAPVWLPDAEAPTCMQCEARFTFTKRRHHCRACGKVFCSGCCNLKSKLDYLEQKEARVCSKCYQDLIRAQYYERTHGPTTSPNPNNPSEYCSTIPPTQQAQAGNAPPPSVMVPVNVVPGVLRKEASNRRSIEPKSVMFSDGIRPGGDLTELDGQAEARIPPQRSGRKSKRVEKTEDKNSSRVKTMKASETSRNICLIPEEGLPPVILSTGIKGDYSIEENPVAEKIMPQIQDEEASPVVFALNKNLFVMVKILNLDCCVNRVSWCFTTKGMCTVGQDEIVVVLECLPDEKTIPRDLFCHFNTVYEEAGKGNTVSHLGHTIFAQGILGSRDHGGFLYIKPTFQCTHKLLMPPAPYIFGILLQKWETPWAKIFPIRLMLRLGAEFRYYPCPLVSVRFRKPVFGEIGHTIMNLLADFRNYQYMLPQVRGVAVHMEDKKTYINFPRNRYDDVIKVINNSNDHVMGLGANFSTDADSHLVCIQNEDGNYQTQAINIQNKPRKVTGASFIVFNGALKTSSGLRAKSSIVEDGLMIQITADSMAALKQALRDMKDYTIGCGAQDVTEPEEWVVVRWVADDKNVNAGVKSPLDNRALDGVESLHITNATDYVGENRTIRWTEVFFIRTEGQNTRIEPVDLSRLAESLSTACCLALTPHLDKLKEASLTKLGLRVTIDREQVGYEIGSNGEKLPGAFMNDLDNELILVIHNAASQSQEGPLVLELIFHVIE